MRMLAFGIEWGELVLIFCALVFFGLWLWALVDCLAKEPSEGNTKVVWCLVIIFVPCLVGVLLYFTIRRPQREREAQAAKPNPDLRNRNG